MAVRRSQTGGRVLRVLELIASHQPIGTRALARLTGDDKSAIHRSIMTLADEGWIRPTATPPMQWEVSPRILAVADKAYGGFDLKRRSRPALEHLRDECGETVVLVVPDVKTFVVADVVESREMLRVVPAIGGTVTAQRTAAGRAMLPFLEPHRQAALLGQAPDAVLLAMYAHTRALGYAISERETNPGATSIGAPIIEYDGYACGAVIIIGPSERLAGDVQTVLGKRVAHAALTLSRGVPPPAADPERGP